MDNELPDPERVLVCGDWHGNTSWALSCLWYAHRKGAQVIVQVGDFGFWTRGPSANRYLYVVNRDAARLGITVYWLDGNHEDHSRRAEFNSPDRPNTIHLPRGSRWSWWGKRFMAVGGAHSVDKFMRKTEGPNRTWWDEEHLTEEEVAYASRDDGTPVDVVFAHDCPRGVNIPGVGPDTKGGVRGDWPADALYEAEIHRTKCRTIWEATLPQEWIHGHYHIPYVAYLAKKEIATRFIGLGCDGDLLTKTVTVLTFDPELNLVVVDPPIH